MYELILSNKIKLQLKKLPEDMKNRIGRSLEKIRIRPHHFVKRIVGTKFFALRSGDHRIILDIVNKDLVIYALELGHRKKIYSN